MLPILSLMALRIDGQARYWRAAGNEVEVFCLSRSRAAGIVPRELAGAALQLSGHAATSESRAKVLPSCTS